MGYLAVQTQIDVSRFGGMFCPLANFNSMTRGGRNHMELVSRPRPPASELESSPINNADLPLLEGEC